MSLEFRGVDTLDEALIQELLAGSSEELTELKEKSGVLIGFLELTKKLDSLPKVEKRFYENNRSLYQATSIGREMGGIENILKEFFGPPVKHAGNSLPITLKLNNSVKHLSGIKKNQTFFLLQLKHGEFYGALWPWTKDPRKIEIHLGYCSDKIQREDYTALEKVVKKYLSHTAFHAMDTSIGGQIHGIGLPSFLQMAEMEGVTLTLKITAKRHHGFLHLAEGSLVAAETSRYKGREAAYRIVSWDNPIIQIEQGKEGKTNEIQLPLMHLLMESLKIKDEAAHENNKTPAPETAAGSRNTTSDSDVEGQPIHEAAQLSESTPSSATAGVPSPAPDARPPSGKRGKRKSRWIISLSLVLILLLAAGGGGVFYLNKRKAAAAYADMLKRVENANDELQRIAILTDYILTGEDRKYVADAEQRRKALQEIIEKNDYEQVGRQVAALELNEAYKETVSRLYQDFLALYPEGRFSEAARQKLDSITERMDKTLYDRVRAAKGLSFSKRFETYYQYLMLMPVGQHRAEVDLLISKMGHEYFAYIETEVPKCEKIRQWDACLTLCDNFFAVFKNSAVRSEVKAIKTKLIEEKLYDALLADVQQAGEDYGTAKKLYLGYLEQYPKSSRRINIQKKMNRLDGKLASRMRWENLQVYADDPKRSLTARIGKVEGFIVDTDSKTYRAAAGKILARLKKERASGTRTRTQEKSSRRQSSPVKRKQKAGQPAQEAHWLAERQIEMQTKLAALSQRYRTSQNGTVKDLHTGLEWTLLDSQQQLGQCMDYRTARAFVDQLKIDGHGDWRLPTSSELAAIYKSAPHFPDAGAPWYWTSEAFVKGYHHVVNIVTAKPSAVYERSFVDEDQCGAVRAVRP